MNKNDLKMFSSTHTQYFDILKSSFENTLTFDKQHFHYSIIHDVFPVQRFLNCCNNFCAKQYFRTVPIQAKQ